MAESMLAALAALHHKSAATIGTSAAAQHTVHGHTSELSKGNARQQPKHVVMPGPRLAAGGQKGKQHGEESAQAPENESGSRELHWEPAVQLPSLQAADAGRSLELLKAAEPVPSGQVSLQSLHRCVITCCTSPTAPLHHICRCIQVCRCLRLCRSLLGEGSCGRKGLTIRVLLQLMAPPRDARRLAREARKAVPDTAGRYGSPGIMAHRRHAELSVHLEPCIYVVRLRSLALCEANTPKCGCLSVAQSLTPLVCLQQLVQSACTTDDR